MGSDSLQTLRDNLNRYIGDGKRFSSNADAARASGVSRSTIDRVRRSELSPGLDKLDGLAKALGIEPWELLYPNLNIEDRPSVRLRGVQWPLPGVKPDEYQKIPQEERDEVTALAQSKVKRHSKSRIRPAA